jgi:hypothetical protein
MANKITQRLIAAGASPQRAQAFAQQFTKQVQAAQPSITKPKDIQDAFDAEIAAFAAAQYPGTFKPPTINDPRIRDYVIGAYGSQVLDTIIDKSFSFKAPDLDRVLLKYPNLKDIPDNQLGLDALIVKKVYIEEQPIGQVKNDLASGIYKDSTGKKAITGALLPSEYSALVDKYSSQNAAQQEEETKQIESFLSSDKYYKVGLVTPKITYGQTEDLTKGVIDFRTHPSVARVINEEYKKVEPAFKAQEEKVAKTKTELQTTYGTKGPQSSAAAGIVAPPRDPRKQVEDKVFNLFTKSGATPFIDEVKRRESLKKTTTLGK